MASMEQPAGDISVFTPQEFAALLVRVVVGSFYVAHPILMWSIYGAGHAAHPGVTAWAPYAVAAGELAGGTLLLLGVSQRLVAVALLPILLAAALQHVAAGFGVSVAHGAYLVGCLAGQAFIATGASTASTSELG